MRRHIFVFLLLIVSNLFLAACSSSESSFNIQFIDVGQGDAALIECDGHHMLIDGGDTTAGEKVYDVLEEQGVQHLDILAVSHMHADHIGGLAKALTYATTTDKVISNTTKGNSEVFNKFKHQIELNGSKISIPNVGERYKLGTAEVEVIDVSTTDENDSLVLLVTYGDTRCLFAGDIGNDTQKRIADQYMNDSDEPFKIDILKTPHHGGDINYYFIRTFTPDYAIIPVGKGNHYNHPYDKTLDMLEQANVKVYRTDIDGDITVKSDGKQLAIQSSR